jgi:hypothetical protein
MMQPQTGREGATLEPQGTGIPRIPWEIRWLPVQILQPDPAYQRRFEPAIARRLAERHIPALAAGLRVSERDGVHWVKDGWHRVQAAVLLGHSHVYCYVEKQTQAEEARAFVRLNSGTKVQSLQRFAAALLAGDEPDVVETNRIITEAGFRVDYDMRQRDPHSFWAVTTALAGRTRRTSDVAGPERLRRVLLLARETWPAARGGAQSTILRALDRLFGLYGPGGFNRADFVRKVGALEPDEVVLKAHRASHAHGHDTYLWALQEMVVAYNRARTDPGRRLDLPIPLHARFSTVLDDPADDNGAQEEEAEA